jgi:hypothetical protein
MRIKRPIPEPECHILCDRNDLDVRGGLIGSYSMFFDDIAAVMYRKIDTTPLSATFLTIQSRTGKASGSDPGPLVKNAASDPGRVMSLFIPSRMTHRLLFAPAGAPSERMIL